MSKLKLILVTAFANCLDMAPFFTSYSFRMVPRTDCRLHGTSFAKDLSWSSKIRRKYGLDGAVKGRFAVTIQPTVSSLALLILHLAVGISKQRRFEGGSISAHEDSASALSNEWSDWVIIWDLIWVRRWQNTVTCSYGR
jgi:hypothetical protein